MHNLTGGGQHGAQMRSSNTWTTSSGELGQMSDTDELEDRTVYAQEYNRLAKKVCILRSLTGYKEIVTDTSEQHGVRLLEIDDFKLPKPVRPNIFPLLGNLSKLSPLSQKPPKPQEKRNWLLRLLRSSSANPTAPQKAATGKAEKQPMNRKRSVSDMAHNLLQNCREPYQPLDLQSMVRISGKSILYLPPDYTPGSLILPTCIRATAHYLSQHATTRGLFRIPGSVKVVNALFDYYCYIDNTGGSDVTNTVRCANLPAHIQSSVHDVASTFKRMLCVIPGGILGNLALFDAFVAIHSQLEGDPEFPRTKQTKVRARLLALAIACIESQFRRELVCAVFGLLSLIGRAAEVMPREDEDGRPLPTTDLMGYSALGIVFGPLLVGDLMDKYDMNLATPSTGLLVFPLTSKKKKDCGKSGSPEKPKNPSAPPTINKIHVANGIAEMLIANWRDVVRQLKLLGMHHHKDVPPHHIRYPSLRPSISESFIVQKSRDWERGRTESSAQVDRDYSPEAGPSEPRLAG